MANAAAIHYVLSASPVLDATDLVYVVAPSQEAWEVWDEMCEGNEMPEDVVPVCDLLRVTTFEPTVPFHAESESGREITEALRPASAVFIEDPSSVLVEGSLLPRRVINDARLLRIGPLLEEGGLVYVTIHEHAEGGALLELTPDATGGWDVEQLWQYRV